MKRSRVPKLVAPILLGLQIIALPACGDPEEEVPPHGFWDEYQQGCLRSVLDLNEGAVAELPSRDAKLQLFSTLGKDSLNIVATWIRTRDRSDVRLPWWFKFFEFNTSLVQDSLPTQRGSHFALRINPEDYWFTAPYFLWLQLDLYAPLVEGSRGRGLEQMLRPGRALEVVTHAPADSTRSLPDFGASLQLARGCVSSDFRLGPAPNGDQSITVRSFEAIPTEQDTTYQITLDFDMEVYGARRLTNDNLPWRGSLYFEYLEDRG